MHCENFSLSASLPPLAERREISHPSFPLYLRLRCLMKQSPGDPMSILRRWRVNRWNPLSLSLSPYFVNHFSQIEFAHDELCTGPKAHGAVSLGFEDILSTTASESKEFGGVFSQCSPPVVRRCGPFSFLKSLLMWFHVL